MDRRSWLWRRKSSEKSAIETEGSGSISSFSERFSDDQEALRASPITASPSNAQSPDVSSKVTHNQLNETVKSLHEKLSAALISISAKEDLVKQHTKVAEEAVAGWENAEKEVATLKQKLEASSQKNSTLEERIGHLDGALKECVRQLAQSREEQQKKFNESLARKTTEWESKRISLETCISDLQSKLEVQGFEALISNNRELQLKLQALEREKTTLKNEVQMKTLERELITQTAESASKQHLESIRKVAKLEAECRTHTCAKKSSPLMDRKILRSSSVCIESITDSQSESLSDSWSSAPIAELDQFKNDKVPTKSFTSPIEIDLMDDFLEIEKLAALPEASSGISGLAEPEHESLKWRIGELEEKVQKVTIEKREMEAVLTETRNKLKNSREQFVLAEGKLVELQRQLNSANALKHVLDIELQAAESWKKEAESQLQSSHLEIKKLVQKLKVSEGECAELASKCLKLEGLVAKKEELEGQLKMAQLEVKKLNDRVGFLEGKAEEEKSLYTKLAAKCQHMKVIECEKMDVESKLKSAQVEAKEIQAKVYSLEGTLKEERKISISMVEELSSELNSARVEADKLKVVERKLSWELADKNRKLAEVERKREELETQLSSSQIEVFELANKVSLLEGEVEEHRGLKSQLESAHCEIKMLSEKAKLLQKEIEEEKALSAEFAAQCQCLEDELVKNQQLPASSTTGPKIRQERAIEVAAEKFSECQKMIASLNQQLKLMVDFDALMLGSASLPNNQEILPPCSQPLSLPGFGSFMSLSMSYTHIGSL